MFSKGVIDIKTRIISHDGLSDDAIANIGRTDIADRNIFYSTIDSTDSVTGVTTTGTQSNILGIIPDAGSNDVAGKPVKFSIEIETSQRTQINELSFYWRPVNSYLQ